MLGPQFKVQQKRFCLKKCKQSAKSHLTMFQVMVERQTTLNLSTRICVSICNITPTNVLMLKGESNEHSY